MPILSNANAAVKKHVLTPNSPQVCLILLAVIGASQLVHAQNQSESLLDELVAVGTRGTVETRGTEL